MPDTLHLIRHGEVENPDGIVYGDLPGFGLSDTGHRQAAAAAELLGTRPIDEVRCSPLQRAVETAQPIAAAIGCELLVDERLTEFHLGSWWAGLRWDRLEVERADELAAYLNRPTDLPFLDESIHDVADRMAAVVDEITARSVVMVSHQDPVQALRLRLRGLSLERLQRDKPGHVGVVILDRTGDGWIETAMWHPDIVGDPFPPPQSDSPD